MTENINDDKTGLDSSTTQTDDKTAMQVVETADSSTVEAAKPTSTEDIVSAVLEKHEGSDSAPKTDAEGKPLEPEKLPEGQVKKEEQAKTPEQLDKEKKENERLDKNPRFQEVLTRAKTAEEKTTKLEAEVKVWRDTQEFLQSNNITPDAYKETIQWRALAGSNDPKSVEQALTKAEEVCEQLRLRLGKSLPADLQTAVDGGQMTQEWAAQLAKARMAEQGHQSMIQTQQSLSQQQQQQLVQSSLATWVTGKQTSDPSFKESENGVDGLFEDVGRRMNALVTQKFSELKRPLNAQEMVQIAEESYQGAVKYRSQFTPKPPVRRPPLNGSSRINGDTVPKYTNDDILADVASRHGGGL